MRFKPDWFLVGLAAAIGLAWLAPGPGSPDGWLHPQAITNVAVAVIFFLHGARLSLRALRDGVMNWRLHLLVQAATFVLFPAIGLALFFALRGRLGTDLALGLFYLCAVPSTISSAIILTGVARGNVAGAVFNATLSNLIGVVLTPLWVTAAMRTTGAAQPLWPVIVDLVTWLVLPLLAGQVMRRWVGDWLSAHRRGVSGVDRGAILLLVYMAFCASFRRGAWSDYGVGRVALTVFICAALFATVFLLVRASARLAGFNRADEIAAIFCGSKKTLAAGVPMAKLIFGAYPAIGLVLLPLMIYHPLQLVICGVLAQRWANHSGTTP